MDLFFLLLLSVLLLILLQSAYTFFLRNESFLCYKYSSLITIIVLILKYTLSEDNTDTQHSFENNLHNNTNIPHFIELHRLLRFLQIKVKILHQPKEYDFLHFDTCFTWWSGINLQNLWGMSVPFSSFDFYLYLYIKSIKIAYRQYIVESCF